MRIDEQLNLLHRAAAEHPMPLEEVQVQLAQALHRTVGYLAHRARRGTHTATDDALQSDCEAIANALRYLQQLSR